MSAGFVETHRSTVEAWEVDDNDHLNVQFYFGRFAQAGAHYHIATGTMPALQPGTWRHARFHRELRVEDLIRIESGAAHEDGVPVTLHRLLDATSGELAATAVDRTVGVSALSDDNLPALDEVALPRSLGPDAPEVGTGVGVPTGRWVVRPEDCDGSGGIGDRGMIGLVSRANPHFWNGSPCNRTFMAPRGYGRAVVEMRLAVLGRPPAGTPVTVTTRPLAAFRVALTVRHVLRAAATGTPIAVVESATVILDRAKRKAQPLPDEMRAWVEMQLALRG